jgi:hypothetical protein
MIKLDIVNLVADKTGVPKQKAEQVVDSLFNAMKDALLLKTHRLRGFNFLLKPVNAAWAKSANRYRCRSLQAKLSGSSRATSRRAVPIKLLKISEFYGQIVS